MKKALLISALIFFVNTSCFASQGAANSTLAQMYSEVKQDQWKEQLANRTAISNELTRLGYSQFELDFLTEQISYNAKNKLHMSAFEQEKLARSSNPVGRFVNDQIELIIENAAENLERKEVYEILNIFYEATKRMSDVACSNFYVSYKQVNIDLAALAHYLNKQEREYIVSLLKKAQPKYDSLEKTEQTSSSKGSYYFINPYEEKRKEEARIESMAEEIYSKAIKERLMVIKPEKRRKILQALLEPTTVSKKEYCAANIFNLETVLMNESVMFNNLVMKRFIKGTAY